MITGEHLPEGPHESPGMHLRHYSPRTPVFLVEAGRVPPEGRGAYLKISDPPQRKVSEAITMPSNAQEYAASLYRILHDLDAKGYDWIAVEKPTGGGEWEAVLDRLRRASSTGLEDQGH